MRGLPHEHRCGRSQPQVPLPASNVNAATRDPAWVRYIVLGLALGFFVTFLLLPLIVGVRRSVSQGLAGLSRGAGGADALSAIKLTLMAAAIAVPLNVVFGVAAAWAITKFEFRGKQCSSPSSICRSPCPPWLQA